MSGITIGGDVNFAGFDWNLWSIKKHLHLLIPNFS